jgi:hypothetical protein
MQIRSRATVLLAVLAASVLTIAGCSSDGASLDDYFADLEALSAVMEQGAAPAFETLDSSDDLTELKAAFGQLPVLLDDYVTGLEDLDPPEEAKESHQAAVTAGQSFLTQLTALDEEVQATGTLDEFIETAGSDSVQAASDELEARCSELQQIAEENDIEVDLACGAI